jgi:hypothetical protein
LVLVATGDAQHLAQTERVRETTEQVAQEATAATSSATAAAAATT